MTTARQFYIRDVRGYEPDKLLETLNIQLTDEQIIYLKQNKDDMRTLLLKKFNLKFGTQHTKLQLTRAIEVMNQPKHKLGVLRDPNKPKNLTYRKKDNCWEARVTVKKVRKVVYRGTKEDAIQAVVEFKKKHGIR